MAYNIVIGLAAFILSVATLFAVYFFFRSFKDSSLAQPLVIIDLGLLVMAFHTGLELLEGAGIVSTTDYDAMLEIISYVVILIGLFVARKAFKSFDWLKELARSCK